MGDRLSILVYYIYPVLLCILAMGTVAAMVAVVVVPWRRRRSRVER